MTSIACVALLGAREPLAPPTRPNRLRTLRFRSVKKSWKVVVVTSSMGNVTSSRGNVTSWTGNVTSSIGIAPVWIAARGVSLGTRRAPMQAVTRRNESRHPSIETGDGSIGGGDRSFETAPLSVRTQTRSLENVVRRFETVPGRRANGTLSKERPSHSIGRSPSSIQSGHGCFGHEHSSIRPRHRPRDAAPTPKEEGHGRIEEGPVSTETGAPSTRTGRVSIERGTSSIERDRFSIERGSFSIDGVPFSTRRYRMPRDRERFALSRPKAASDGGRRRPGAWRPPRPSH